MRMILKSLHMENFKGIKSLDVNFSNKTSIKGQNAVGKTTIFDAFTWLLFNKNSAGEEKFNVRPLDKNNKRIDNVEIKVVGVIEVDGKEVELSKVQKQNDKENFENVLGREMERRSNGEQNNVDR